jgi:hypothetical protein
LRLANEQHQIEGAIVRLTMQYAQSMTISFVYHMRLVAGFVAQGQLVSLSQACGDVMRQEPQEEHTVRTRARAEAMAAQIEALCQELGLSLRKGLLQDGGNRL